MAPAAVEWLAEASPKLATVMASAGQGDRMPSFAARPIENATPTALGRCDAIVDVCGMMASRWFPKTLWRPPAIGSPPGPGRPRRTSPSGRGAGPRAAQGRCDRRVALVSRGPDGVETAALGPQVASRQVQVPAARLGVEQGDRLLPGQPGPGRDGRGPGRRAARAVG